MRRENLLDGGHNKVIWKRSRDRRRDKLSRQRSSETWWRRTTATLLRVWFGSYRRTCRDVQDVLDMYHWDVLVTYHWGVVGGFIWDLFEKSERRTDGTLSLCPLETSSRHANKTAWKSTTEKSWRRSTKTWLGVSFEKYLRRRHDVLLPGRKNIEEKYFPRLCKNSFSDSSWQRKTK